MNPTVNNISFAIPFLSLHLCFYDNAHLYCQPSQVLHPFRSCNVPRSSDFRVTLAILLMLVMVWTEVILRERLMLKGLR